MGTTAHGLPWPEGTDRVRDGDDAIRALAEAIDTMLLGDTGSAILSPIAAGFTLKTGFTSLTGSVRRRGNTVSVSLVFISTNALGAGNIANIACIGIPSGWLPATRTALGPAADGPGIFSMAETNGSIYIVSTPAATTAGDTLSAAGLWMLA